MKNEKIENKLLLKPEDFKPTSSKLKIEGILNPGAIRMPDKRIMLMVRVSESILPKYRGKLEYQTISSINKIMCKNVDKKDSKKSKKLDKKGRGTGRLTQISHFRKVILDKTGLNIEEISQEPDFNGKENESEYGVEDPRLIKIGKKYYMTYVGVSGFTGISSFLAVSKNLKNWKRLGLIFRQQNKDVVLFPEKIKGKYVALSRPAGSREFGKLSIWLSYSRDLLCWGGDTTIIQPIKGRWDEYKVGAGAPPIKTKNGWLVIYHGAKKVKNPQMCQAGAFLLDLKNPEKVLARSPKNKPFFSPTKPYEKSGFTNKVVFPTGVVRDLNKKDLLIYSGGADSVVTVRKIPIKNILESMEYY